LLNAEVSLAFPIVRYIIYRWKEEGYFPSCIFQYIFNF
jgi:hypothetical protein